MPGLPPVQKYLGWLQRLLFQIEVPTTWYASAMLVPVVDASVDWPLNPTLALPADVVTIAGNVSTTIYQPAVGRHGLVYAANMIATAGGPVPATDDIILSLQDTVTLSGVRLHKWSNISLNDYILVGGGAYDVGGAGLEVSGFPRPVYVKEGQRLRLDETSVAGGVTTRVRAWVIDLPDFQPIPRLP